MIKHQLSMSTSYIAQWGLAEALRELLQNALDQVRRNSDSELIFDYDPELKRLRIGATNCELARKTLLLGVSDKRNDNSLIGNEGEGYKLAMLVLSRECYGVEVGTGSELWTAKIVKNEELGCDILEVSIVTAHQHSNDVVFTITGILPSLYYETEAKIYLPDAEDDTIISDRPGEVFVGGLLICHVVGCHDGYNFRPGVLVLNRDRNMVASFNLFWETSKLWQKPNVNIDRLKWHLENKHRDVINVVKLPESHAQAVYSSFRAKHGDSVPVYSDAEAKEALASGCSIALVSEPLCKVLRAIGNFIFRRRKLPSDWLQEWFEKNGSNIETVAAEEFRQIIVESKGWWR